MVAEPTEAAPHHRRFKRTPEDIGAVGFSEGAAAKRPRMTADGRTPPGWDSGRHGREEAASVQGGESYVD